MNIFESLEQLNVSEECFDSIMNIVEEYINERNRENRQKKKEWEMKKTEETSPLYFFSKKYDIPRNEQTIKDLKKYSGKDKNKGYIQKAVDAIARSNRVALGRQQDPVSNHVPLETMKTNSRVDRIMQSQRGSTKDSLRRDNDELEYKNSALKDMIKERK